MLPPHPSSFVVLSEANALCVSPGAQSIPQPHSARMWNCAVRSREAAEYESPARQCRVNEESPESPAGTAPRKTMLEDTK